MGEIRIMMFDEYGVRIRSADIQKRESVHTRSPMNNNSSGLCKGICQQYKAKKPLFRGRYAAGQVRCQICEIYLRPDGIIQRNGAPYCICCNYKVRTKPRNSFYKEQYHEQVTRNVNEPWIKPQSDDENWWLEESTKERIKQESEDDKKSTPIYDEIDESIKTYYEFKEFLKSEIKPQANYQFVMLKELLEYGELHKGEIAESLAYFNNKDSSDINSVKYYFDVPVYDVLLKHEFITVNDGFKFPYYSLNVILEDFQRIELVDYLNNALAQYNEEHNIPENKYPNANNMGSIDWSSYNIKSMSNIQKMKNFTKKMHLTSTNSSWIWSVTPENWEIVKSKNIWGSKIPKERIGLKVQSGDQVAFYVIGSNCFKGIFEFVGEWFDSTEKTWDDDLEPDGSLRYKSRINLRSIQLGSVNVPDLYEKIQLFIGKPQNIRNLILQGGSGYPSNNSRPLLKDDFEIIKYHLTQSPSISEPKVEEETTKIVKECPRCHYKIEGFENDQQFSDKIEKMFGHRQMDPDDPLSKKLQSYCRKCRSFERVLANEKPLSLTDNVSTEPKHLTIFDSQKDGINIQHFEMLNSEFIQKGQNLTNDELVEKFRVGNMGGIRSSSKYNLLVLCDTESGHYNDEIDKEFEIIYYTGEGKTGDQTLTRGNLRIAESKDTPMFYFLEVPQEPGKNKRGALGKIYRFIGKVRYLKHAIKTENDINGNPHQVIKFLLEVEN